MLSNDKVVRKTTLIEVQTEMLEKHLRAMTNAAKKGGTK